MVNDDKPFLRIANEGILVCGSPWSGKHGLDTNIEVPLKAICILERGAENRIRPIEMKEALMMLMQQSNRPLNPALLPKYLELIDALARESDVSILFYHWHRGCKLGAHFVALRHTEQGFIGYNTYRGSTGPDSYGDSLEGFIKERKFFGCVLLGIKDKR